MEIGASGFCMYFPRRTVPVKARRNPEKVLNGGKTPRMFPGPEDHNIGVHIRRTVLWKPGNSKGIASIGGDERIVTRRYGTPMDDNNLLRVDVRCGKDLWATIGRCVPVTRCRRITCPRSGDKSGDTEDAGSCAPPG